MKSQNRILAGLVLLLILATGLRAWQIDAQSIWFDEGFSWHAARQPSLLDTLNGDPTNPPAYYLLLHIWIRLVGDSEFALRTLSLLQGIVLISVLYRLSTRWFSPEAGLVAGGISTFLPLLWWASQEARMYNTLALAVLLVTWGFLAIVNAEASRAKWFAVVAGEVLALYTHNTGIVVLGGVNVAFALLWLANSLGSRRNWRLLGRWLLSQSFVVIVWIPELLARFRNVSPANAASRTPPALSIDLLWRSWQALWANSWEMVLASPQKLITVCGFLLVLLIPALWALRVRRGRQLWVLLGALYAVLVSALMVLGVNLHGRYLVMLAPLLVMLVAAGSEAIIKTLNLPRASLVFAPALAALAWVLLPGQPQAIFQHDQARDMVAYYANHLEQGDIIVSWSYAERYDLAYYARQHGLESALLTIPEGAEPETIVTLLNAALPPGTDSRVEINTWYTQGSDRRNALPCIVGNGAPAPEATHTVQGMTTTAYIVRAPVQLPAAQPTEANLGPVKITGIALPTEARPAHTGVCIPVQVTVQHPPNDPLVATVKVLGSEGNEIAAADAPLLTSAQVPVNRLRSGEHATAFPLLYLPQGVPAGSYQVQVRVYSPSNPSGLDLLHPETGAPTGKDYDAGLLQVSRGTWPPFQGDCDLAISDSVSLTNCAEVQEQRLTAGTPALFTLAWQVDTPSSPVTLTLAGDEWAHNATVEFPNAGPILYWHSFAVPAEASGEAVLTAQASGQPSVTIATFPIARTEHIMTPPAGIEPLNVRFPGLGTLVGYTALPDQLIAGESIAITLYWLAEQTTPQPYTVTVQLVNPQVGLLAQHDSQPALGIRPTTGWVAGEYIEDSHTVSYREEFAQFEGTADLIVAVYSAGDGARLLTTDGTDSAVILQDIAIVTP